MNHGSNCSKFFCPTLSHIGDLFSNVTGDKIGNMTYLKNDSGASTIDYNLWNLKNDLGASTIDYNLWNLKNDLGASTIDYNLWNLKNGLGASTIDYNLWNLKNDLGASTIDYNLCNFNIFNFIDDFLVLPMTGLSDHSEIIRIFKKKTFPVPKINLTAINGKCCNRSSNGIPIN